MDETKHTGGCLCGGVRYEVMLFGYPLDDPGAPAPDAGPAAPSDPAPRS